LGVNDAWLIGGVNGGNTFNFVGETRWANNLDDLLGFLNLYIENDQQQQHPVTVTAREILGLKQAGYIPNIVNDTLLFTPPAQNAVLFDFVEYHSILNRQDATPQEIIADYLYNIFR
jgi:hypothetical protein